MTVANIIDDIENSTPNKVDRVIIYSEIILFLQELASGLRFQKTDCKWKDYILDSIRQDNINDIEENIKLLRKWITFNVKH